MSGTEIHTLIQRLSAFSAFHLRFIKRSRMRGGAESCQRLHLEGAARTALLRKYQRAMTSFSRTVFVSSGIETNLAAEEDRESLLEFKRLKLKRFLCC